MSVFARQAIRITCTGPSDPLPTECSPRYGRGDARETSQKDRHNGSILWTDWKSRKAQKNWTVVYRYRNPGELNWQKKRITICPICGPGAMGPLERERRKIAVLEQAGVNTEETIQTQIKEHVSSGATFQQQAEAWLYGSQTRNRNPIQEATATGYRSYLRNHLNPVLGELPLSAVDNDALKGLVKKLHEDKGKLTRAGVSEVD